MRVWFSLVLTLLVAGPASAQSGPPRPSPDFLFGRPDGTIGIRGSLVTSRAGSDWYDFITDQLTIDKKDFRTGGFGTDAGITLASRADLLIAFDYTQSTQSSEYRDFVDNNRLPIAQQTFMRNLSLTGAIKFALRERGREVGRLAWVPKKYVPFAGAGGGMMWFQMKQNGDFIDYVDLSVFHDVFDSKGWTPTAHVFGGVDVRVLRRAYATFDARYIFASGDLGPDWVDFDPIDLSGFRLSAGINFIISEVR